MSKPFVFTLMPFSSDFDDRYKLGIKTACTECGAYCERVDEQVVEGSILDRIFNQISKADVIIADMTGKNPNVFFEVGYAKALGKRMILLTSRVEDIPFDFQHFSHVIYNDSISTLKEKLGERLAYYFANPSGEQSDLMVGVNLYVLGVCLNEGVTTKVETPQNHNFVPLTIENVSGQVIEASSMQVVAKSEKEHVWLFRDLKSKQWVMGRDNKDKWVVYNEKPLFHGAEISYPLCNPPHVKSGSERLHLSVFTRHGRGSYFLEMVPVEKSK